VVPRWCSTGMPAVMRHWNRRSASSTLTMSSSSCMPPASVQLRVLPEAEDCSMPGTTSRCRLRRSRRSRRRRPTGRCGCGRAAMPRGFLGSGAGVHRAGRRHARRGRAEAVQRAARAATAEAAATTPAASSPRCWLTHSSGLCA
jgi:hypothetical protein